MHIPHRLVLPGGFCFEKQRENEEGMKVMMPYPVINLEETGRNIRNMILERDMSVADISRFLGINRSSVYKVMRGDAVFSLDNMFALSMLLNTSVNDMIVAG